MAQKTLNGLQNTLLRDNHPVMIELFQAVIEATEESVYQSLLHAEKTIGRQGRIVEKWSIG